MCNVQCAGGCSMYVRQVYREMCRGLEENALAYIPGGGVGAGGEGAREKGR